jgi:hypothetical protein
VSFVWLRVRELRRLRRIATVAWFSAICLACGNSTPEPPVVTPPPVAVTNINSRRNMETMKIQRALLSVSDKTGLDKFAKGLVAQNVQLISTGGTCKYLQELEHCLEEKEPWPQTQHARA